MLGARRAVRKSPTRPVDTLPPRRRADLPVAPLAHRVRPENVFIGDAWWDQGRHLATTHQVHAGHPLDGRDAEQLIEAARQFATLAGHSAYGRPCHFTYILRALEADIPVGFPEGEVLLELLPMPSRRSRFDLRVRVFRTSAQGAVEEVGAVFFDAFIVSPCQYDGFRRRNSKQKGRRA
ncbi:AfsA-related hotdog domain-containing protein [Streptomyces cinnamoneus]|uniref:A-factor biosynthesis hotdog domain-containing protein n=1 Tax=Streptomyces cinnamoneus TaxID=53446 RepID=A0A918TR46_STRCJ|nr:AfsA-related hotdog domain-containing protein [Streptomyces cinnamoneus]GHC59638.1 hypothetical protein GCM10010507_40640 [Streptomyces cinnamoneus]